MPMFLQILEICVGDAVVGTVDSETVIVVVDGRNLTMVDMMSKVNSKPKADDFSGVR